jgi:hypothetical protein
VIRVLLLFAGSLLFWVLAAVSVAYLGGPDATWAHSGTALLLCLVPGMVTLAWATHVERQDAGQQMTMLLGSTGLRLFGVLLVALFLYGSVPPFAGQDGFLVWLVACYFFTLALEMALILKGRPRPDSPA